MIKNINFRPLSDVVGMHVTGLDLTRPEDPEISDLLRKKFSEHSLLLVSNQKIRASDQIRFANIFGPVDTGYRVRSGYDGKEVKNRGVMLVSNIRKKGKPIGSLPDGEMQFHSDGAHRDIPYAATTLYAVKIPSHGGNTLFANLEMAYKTLDKNMQKKVDGLKVRNLYGYDDTSREDTTDEKNKNSSAATHDLVKTHPVTGKKSLYLSRLMTRHIIGIKPEESTALLEFLFNHTEKKEFIYSHTWKENDLLIWDNRCLNHARTEFPENEERLLRRFTITEWY